MRYLLFADPGKDTAYAPPHGLAGFPVPKNHWRLPVTSNSRQLLPQRHPSLRSVVVEPRLVISALEVHPAVRGGVVEVRVDAPLGVHPAATRVVEPAVGVGGGSRCRQLLYRGESEISENINCNMLRGKKG
jgi:hypothetical protein